MPAQNSPGASSAGPLTDGRQNGCAKQFSVTGLMSLE